jgi:histidine ammonia-lyase
MNSFTLTLDGSHLKVKDIYRFVNDKNAVVEISADSLAAVKKSNDFLRSEMEEKVIYGVNTGFGPMASFIVGKGDLKQLQINLVRSHATGAGEYIDEEFVLAAMIVRLNTLLQGYSGVSPALLFQLRDYINHRIIPLVPEHGAVGTSGDLVQLAHIAVTIIGEGEVSYNGKHAKTANVLKTLKMSPHVLEPKEGLALINGTAMMSGISSLLCVHADRIVSIEARLGALALELIRGYDDSITEKLHELRPHRGQKMIAKHLRNLLKSSSLISKRVELQKEVKISGEVHKISEDVQNVYSIRCIPQILGPVFDTLEKTRKDIETEINSVTDNPIVDWKGKKFIHGGNFHGDYVAVAIDQLKAGIAKLSLLAERRTNYFLSDKLNGMFPPFLNLKTPGLTLGLQGLQFVATSTAAQNQTLAYPHNVHTISTNAANQDVVSMGTDAALFAHKVIENTYVVLAVELISFLQAFDFINSKKDFSESSQAIYTAGRKISSKVVEDRILTEDVAKIVEFLKTSPLFPVEWS